MTGPMQILTLRISESDVQRLNDQAERLALAPSALARMFLRLGLDAMEQSGGSIVPGLSPVNAQMPLSSVNIQTAKLADMKAPPKPRKRKKKKKRPNQLTRALLMLEQCGGWGTGKEIADQADAVGIAAMLSGNVRKILRTEGLEQGLVVERTRPNTPKTKEYKLTAAGRRRLKEEP